MVKNKKLLFLCHGNICRSPMAELIMKYLLDRNGVKDIFVDSAAESGEEIICGVGNPIYPAAKRELEKNGIPVTEHRARRMTVADYNEFDLIVCMDSYNVRFVRALSGGDNYGKARLLRAFSDNRGDIEDPWYTGRFDIVYKEIYEDCSGLLKAITEGEI